MSITPEQETALYDQPDSDEYVGLVINDEAATLPPGARVSVSINTRDRKHFYEMVQYLAELKLPSLGPVTIARAYGSPPYVYRRDGNPAEIPTVFIMVITPTPPPAPPVFGAAEALVREAVAHVVGS